MRRERRGFNGDGIDMKRVLYIAGGILSLSVIVFIAVFILCSGNNDTQIARYNSSIINEFNETSTVEETSSQMGKSINEVENETTNVVNEVNNTVSEDDEKYAVNTSSSTQKKVENNVEEKTENKEESKEEKEEEVKDPEFAKPVEGEILREYAKDELVYSTTLDEWVTHAGIDIKAEKTTVVKAAEAGTIKSIKNDPRYGLTVVIEHVNGFTSVYSNLLTAEFVEEGETVKKGQTIATVGNTATFEIADESHLHFEILKDNQNVDPELYIK